uniref:Uncharacterized protein n=1 Tax=viral metagenome TaxID=1070528 RepID=A0A6M3LXF6_9ZZZZ
MLNSSDKGVCKFCGEEKEFLSPLIRLTKLEKSEVKRPFNHDFYMKGRICLNELNVQ